MMRRAARNTFFLSVSQIIARLIGFFYFIFMARVLGVEVFGVYNFTLAFIYNFIPVAGLGVARLVLRDISRKRQKTNFYFPRLLPLCFFTSFGAYFLALLLGLILGQSLRQIFYLAILGLFLIPNNLTYLIVSFRNAREKMGYTAIVNIVTPILIALFGIVFVLMKLPLSFILFAHVLGGAVVSLLLLNRAQSWGLAWGWVIDKKFWRYVFSQSWIFALLLILAVFYLRLSVVLVGILKGAYFTGLYGSVFKFIEAIILVPQSLALALFPISSKLLVNNKKRLAMIYKKGLGVLFLFSLPFSLVIIFFSRPILRLAYGSEYLAAAPVFSLLGWALILFFVNVLPGNIILNSTKVKQFLPLAVLNLLLKLVFCLVLISRYSILGAGWAVIGGEMVGLVINNLFVWKILKE